MGRILAPLSPDDPVLRCSSYSSMLVAYPEFERRAEALIIDVRPSPPGAVKGYA